MFDYLTTLKTYRYASYARKSNEAEDRQVHSIVDQQDEVSKIAGRHDVKIALTFSDEKSAKDAYQRSGFSDLIETINVGEADAIICWKLNRLARNGTEAGMIIDMLINKKLRAIVTSQKIYLPSENPVQMYVEFGIAQNTSKDISSDVIRGQRRKAERGWYPVSRFRMGYKHNRDYKETGDDPIIPDDQFELVKTLWKEALKKRLLFCGPEKTRGRAWYS